MLKKIEESEGSNGRKYSEAIPYQESLEMDHKLKSYINGLIID